MRHANISLFVPHAGCPHRCSFCNQNAITGGARLPAPEDVRAAASLAARSLKGQESSAEIAFFGGSFTALPKDYMTSLLEEGRKCVEEYGFGGIRCSTRPDAVGEEILDLLERYGVTSIELGAQSMDDQVLSANRRGHTAAQTEEAARKIKARGFELGLQMMTGLYRDTEEKAWRTAERMIALRPDTVRIYPTVVLPDTELAQLYLRGEYRPQTLEEAVTLCARLLPRFEGAGIRVIRVGLHAEMDIERRRLSGPYHPAFRQLVQSRIFLEQLLVCLNREGPGHYTVAVSPKTLSVALGERRGNLTKLEAAGFSVQFRQDESVERGSFRLTGQ